MSESLVKGDLILRVLDQVSFRWGRNGLEMIGYDPAAFVDEQWYPFADMGNLLSAVKSRLGNNNPLVIYQIGFRTAKDDSRWRDVFQDRDPSEVFITTGRQDSQYRVGTLSAHSLGPKHVRIDFVGDDTDPLWMEFYRGRLQGVLELTGRTGVVHLLSTGQGKGARAYDIKWG